MTPISSLQNALAVSHLEQIGIEVSFGRWLMFSIPFCTICTIIAWLGIILILEPSDIKAIPSIVYETNHNVFTKRNITVIGISALGILLLATSSMTKFIFGDIGIIGLCIVAYMFSSGMLTEVDFNSLSWHTLFLIGGGNVLGKAVSSSGLLEYVAHDIIQTLPMKNPWLALVCILFFAATVATFVSHTVAALILLPIISKIGSDLGIPEVTVIGSALAISAAMALPFSSFPNVNSLLVVDDFQNQYLGVRDFLLTGVPMSVIAVILSATLGYGLISVIGV
jgi:phosphate transporter